MRRNYSCFMIILLVGFYIHISISLADTYKIDVGNEISAEIKLSSIEERVLIYNQVLVDCLLQNIKQPFKIFVEAKAKDNVIFSKMIDVECNYLWCNSKKEDMYFKVVYVFEDENAQTLKEMYLFLQGNVNLRIDLKHDACKFLNSNLEESKYLSNIDYYEKKIYLMLNTLKFYLGDSINIPICKESSIYPEETLNIVVEKINDNFGNRLMLPKIQYYFVDDLNTANKCYKSIYEFFEITYNEALSKIESLIENREVLFFKENLYYSRDLKLSQLKTMLNNNNRLLYVYKEDSKLFNFIGEIYSKVKFIRPTIIIESDLKNRIQYIFLIRNNKIVIFPIIILSFYKDKLQSYVTLSFEYLEKIQDRSYRMTEILKKKIYRDLMLTSDFSFSKSKFMMYEDLLRKFLSNHEVPIELSAMENPMIYNHVRSLDRVHDYFSWGFSRTGIPKSPIVVLRNLKALENRIRERTYKFIKVEYRYDKENNKIIENKKEMTLKEACSDSFLTKLSSYNLLLNKCKINICAIDYSTFDIFAYIYQVSECYMVDPLLIISLIARESDGINNFKEKGAVGLGQFTTSTGEINNLLTYNNRGKYHDFRHHPLLNIGATVIYLREKIDTSLKDTKRGLEDALWYYNFGESNIIKYFSSLKSTKVSEKIDLILEKAPVNDKLGNKKLEVSQYSPTILSYYLFYNLLGISKNNASVLSRDLNYILQKYENSFYFSEG